MQSQRRLCRRQIHAIVLYGYLSGCEVSIHIWCFSNRLFNPETKQTAPLSAPVTSTQKTIKTDQCAVINIVEIACHSYSQPLYPYCHRAPKTSTPERTTCMAFIPNDWRYFLYELVSYQSHLQAQSASSRMSSMNIFVIFIVSWFTIPQKISSQNDPHSIEQSPAVHPQHYLQSSILLSSARPSKSCEVQFAFLHGLTTLILVFNCSV